jgi:hypothetical protein
VAVQKMSQRLQVQLLHKPLKQGVTIQSLINR